MFTNSIDNKPLFTKPDGTMLRDLTQSMFELKNRNYIAFNVYRVPKDYVMRPDLISKAVYNNSLYAEIILKFNGISNPFSIDEGDIILIPNLDSAKETFKSNSELVDVNKRIRDTYRYLDPIKIPKKSKMLKKFDDRQIADTDGKEGALPPNMAREGETQITYRNGRVYFGNSVATCLKNGMSSSEFLTTIINKK